MNNLHSATHSYCAAAMNFGPLRFSTRNSWHPSSELVCMYLGPVNHLAVFSFSVALDDKKLRVKFMTHH